MSCCNSITLFRSGQAPSHFKEYLKIHPRSHFIQSRRGLTPQQRGSCCSWQHSEFISVSRSLKLCRTTLAPRSKWLFPSGAPAPDPLSPFSLRSLHPLLIWTDPAVSETHSRTRRRWYSKREWRESRWALCLCRSPERLRSCGEGHKHLSRRLCVIKEANKG